METLGINNPETTSKYPFSEVRIEGTKFNINLEEVWDVLYRLSEYVKYKDNVPKVQMPFCIVICQETPLKGFLGAFYRANATFLGVKRNEAQIYINPKDTPLEKAILTAKNIFTGIKDGFFKWSWNPFREALIKKYDVELAEIRKRERDEEKKELIKKKLAKTLLHEMLHYIYLKMESKDMTFKQKIILYLQRLKPLWYLPIGTIFITILFKENIPLNINELYKNVFLYAPTAISALIAFGIMLNNPIEEAWVQHIVKEIYRLQDNTTKKELVEKIEESIQIAN